LGNFIVISIIREWIRGHSGEGYCYQGNPGVEKGFTALIIALDELIRAGRRKEEIFTLIS